MQPALCSYSIGIRCIRNTNQKKYWFEWFFFLFKISSWQVIWFEEIYLQMASFSFYIFGLVKSKADWMKTFTICIFEKRFKNKIKFILLTILARTYICNLLVHEWIMAVKSLAARFIFCRCLKIQQNPYFNRNKANEQEQDKRKKNILMIFEKTKWFIIHINNDIIIIFFLSTYSMITSIQF